ncbi:MAG TPA: GNAT family protein [Dehalococcoidia bacterium]|nr:GNAT family protein [Dehalococcoidia bacterium]
MLQPITLEGRFVRLEPLTVKHVPQLAAAAEGRRETFALTGVPHGESEARAYVNFALAEQAANRAVPFATVNCSTRQVVGSTRFFDIAFWDWPAGDPNQRGIELPDALEIGHTWLSADAQRTGINTEAKLLMLTHAFETWHVHRVRLSTDARNERSRRAIERLGAHLDGILRATRNAYDSGIRDSAYYSMLDSEWPEAKAALEKRLRPA